MPPSAAVTSIVAVGSRIDRPDSRDQVSARTSVSDDDGSDEQQAAHGRRAGLGEVGWQLVGAHLLGGAGPAQVAQRRIAQPERDQKGRRRHRQRGRHVASE